MMLNSSQFTILELLTSREEKHSQRKLSELTGFSLGKINKILKELSEIDAISDNEITSKGYKLLEPYRAKRAIFLAAGFGSRLVPVTLNTPKPLVRVNGVRIIDRLIDACIAIGIEDIIVVRGYLSEQFDQLLYKYPMIKFVKNDAYNETNNISSIMCVRHLLSNSYVFESDILLNNPSLIKKYHYNSDYLGIKKNRSDDWCFVLKDGYIHSQQIGGEDCFQEIGISYWNEKDGNELENDIKVAYEKPGGKEMYWDQTQFLIFKGKYKVSVIECKEEDICEIDTYNELIALDKSYKV